MTTIDTTASDTTTSDTTESVIITVTLVPDHLRSQITADIFGVYFPLQLEPAVFSFASQLSEDYSGGFWNFYTLSNGGFYMAPDSAGQFQVSSQNGSECFMTADALGITACLYTYSHLSFGDGDLAATCAEHYHRLREFAFAHAEAGNIFRAID